MMLVSFVKERFLQVGSGMILSTLFGDVLLFAFVCLVCLTIYLPYEKMRKYRVMTKKIGGPKIHWFWGDIKKHGYSHEGMFNSLENVRDFPAMCTYYVGRIHAIVTLHHPDVVKTAMTKTMSKAWMYERFVSSLLREGLIVTSNSSVWKRHRRLLTAIFHFDILKEHCQVFNRNSDALLKAFDEIADTNLPADVAPSICAETYTNMMECVMSQKTTDDHGQTCRFIQDVRDASNLVMERQQNVFYWIDALYKWTNKGKKLMAAQKRLFDEVDRVICDRRSLLESVKNSNSTIETNEIKDEATGKTFTFRKRRGKTMDFLDLLIQTKDQEEVGLTNDEIKDEVITFFVAGMDTVSSATSWTCYLLATHPQEQAKCREEVMRVCGHKEEITMSDISQLTYLTQCIKESLRLFPPVPTVGRALTEDVVFSHRFNNYEEITLKKGTGIAVSIFGLHRNPHVWENPEVFNPERFHPDNLSKIPPFAFIPFAAGSRNCIGQQFAWVQMKVIFTQILRKFELIWDPSIPAPLMNAGAINPPKNGVPLIIKRIKSEDI